MAKRIIYQALTRLWGKFSFWDSDSFGYLRSLSVDYLWLTGVPRHSTGEAFVKGDPGSPYSIEDWFDVNPYLAERKSLRMAEFEALVERAHKAGIKIIIDYIPNHVARNYQGPLPCFDYCDYDWTDTKKVNWADGRTVGEMVKVLKFWAGKGVDGFRCDMVEMVPPESLGAVISNVREEYPELLFVAEVYDRNNYTRYVNEVGFDLLYDKSGVYDILRGVFNGQRSARELTWNWQFLGERQSAMLNFLENHDEQRLCSAQYAGSVDKGWAMVAFSALFNTASFMIYGGQELGENAAEAGDGRTSIFNWIKVSSIEKLKRYVKSGKGLSAKDSACLEKYRTLLAKASGVLYTMGNVWDLCYCNEDRINLDRQFAFVRFEEDAAELVFCNFASEKFQGEIRVPEPLNQTFGDSAVVCADAFDYCIKKI